MKDKLSNEMDGMTDDFVVLTILPREGYEELNMHMVNIMVNQLKSMGVYITVNRPYHNLIKVMKRNGIDHQNIFFIDCVSEKGAEAENAVFLKSAQSLTNIGISLNPIYKSKKHSFIFLDSLDGLSIHHDPNIIIKFVRSMINKIRMHTMNGVMIGLSEDTEQRIIDEIATICDKVIDLTK